jgi:hypothetical protein
MRAQLERAFLILLLLANFGSQVPGLLRHGLPGIPAIAVGLAIVSFFIVLLIRASSKGALFLGLLALAGFIFTGIQFFVAGSLFGVRLSALSVELSLIVSLIAFFCAIDLWSTWKKPSQAVSPPR